MAFLMQPSVLSSYRGFVDPPVAMVYRWRELLSYSIWTYETKFYHSLGCKLWNLLRWMWLWECVSWAVVLGAFRFVISCSIFFCIFQEILKRFEMILIARNIAFYYGLFLGGTQNKIKFVYGINFFFCKTLVWNMIYYLTKKHVL